MAVTDGFGSAYWLLEAPASHAVAVTPSDTVDLGTPAGAGGNVCRGLYVGGAGDVTVITAGGQTVTFSAVPAGTLLPVRASRVKATGTTATLMVALQ